VQDLLAYENDEVSALEIKLNPQIAPELVKNQLQTLLGKDFSVKNRYEQDEAFFKITNLEKKVGYVIFSFTLVLVAFNMIGALWMLVLEKQKDISVLKALGANNTLIARIFLLEGTLLSFIGASIGLLLGFGLCVLQQKYGLVRLDNGGGSFIIDAYPVAMRAGDFVVVVLTVLVIGSLAALLPAIRATRVEGIIRND
jgi:lipoprotein-releasing system permease protein